MAISAKYNPTEVEDKWYKEWMDKGFFKSKPNPDKEPYTITIPPPNVTGVLHMGHMLNNTIQDVLIRKARMDGKEACWVPGTDHASIATEAKVVAMLKEKGINKSDLTREEFLDHAFVWKEKYGGIILEQLKKLGASCDWDRTAFTMDDHYYESVIKVFVDLYNKGYIYRGYRMVNWDPEAQTAVSDEEVIHKEVNSKLYHVRYQVEGTDDYLTIATTRPETILGDTAICINPNDDRYKHLQGKKAIVPFVERSVPIILDEYVDMEFGTGCLKVTPAHDLNDYELGKKHDLEFIDILNPDGTMSKAATRYIGEDRFVVRKKIAKDLDAAGHLVKEEDYRNKVGCSERTDAVIEPRISIQWFIAMKEFSKPAYKAVMEDDVQLVPAKFKNTYRHWMENVQDWCISRQLWWGHRIPAYYYGEGMDDFVVAMDVEEAVKLASEKSGRTISMTELRQDEDVLDTWASSWLWPLEVFKGISDPDNEDYKYYYPTNDLVTAPEILFFWVARMIIAGYEYGNEKPFKNVYLTGIVRDNKRRKMSKSLGNSPDPFDLIGKYGADGVRTGMLFSSPAGNDLLFDEKLCEQGRNFSNKTWNAFRLIKSWEIAEKPQDPAAAIAAIWFENRINQVLEELEDLFGKFRLSEALMSTYKLVWNDFCSWYLEAIKPAYGEPVDSKTYEQAIDFIEKLMKILHPFMPFISEEIWQNLQERSDDYLIVAKWPQKEGFDTDQIKLTDAVFDAVTNIRNIRNTKGISPKETLDLHIKSSAYQRYVPFAELIIKLANVGEVINSEGEVENAASFIVDKDEFFLPLGDHADASEDNEKIEEDIRYFEGFIAGIDKKLGNEKFVNNAPEKVVAMERKKKADAEAKIAMLKAKL